MIDDPDNLDISELFYYYVVTRQAMMKAGFDNAIYSEYISNSLVTMGQAYKSQTVDLPLLQQKYHPINMNILTKNTAEGRTLSIRAYVGTLLLVFDGFMK